MKVRFFGFLLILIVPSLYSQALPTHDEIFRALYGSRYDSATKLATWHCPQDGDAAPDGCMSDGDSTAEIDLLQITTIDSRDSPKAYVVTSASGRLPDCHACAPIILVGVFALRAGQWILESKSSDGFRFGAWADPADVEIVKIGPKLYGFMFTKYDGGQGYFGTYARLLSPEEKTIRQVWEGMLDENNEGAYDPTGKDGTAQLVHVDAAYRFLMDGEADHYMLQVISRGYGYGQGSTYQSRNLVATYRFTHDRYELIRKPARAHSK